MNFTDICRYKQVYFSPVVRRHLILVIGISSSKEAHNLDQFNLEVKAEEALYAFIFEQKNLT